jgi:hypothetical protein
VWGLRIVSQQRHAGLSPREARSTALACSAAKGAYVVLLISSSAAMLGVAICHGAICPYSSCLRPLGDVLACRQNLFQLRVCIFHSSVSLNRIPSARANSSGYASDAERDSSHRSKRRSRPRSIFVGKVEINATSRICTSVLIATFAHPRCCRGGLRRSRAGDAGRSGSAEGPTMRSRPELRIHGCSTDTSPSRRRRGGQSAKGHCC